MRYRFGQHAFDTTRHELFSAGVQVHLPPKSYQLLLTLLESRPGVVSKDDLHDRLWPGVHVSDASLARVVCDLRHALGDNARQSEFVKTVHGFGYAFQGEVEEVEEVDEGEEVIEGDGESEQPEAVPLSRHVVVYERQRLALREGDNVFGRDGESLLTLDAAQISRRHCRIRVAADVATLEDLGSKNGTYLRGERVDRPVRLERGDLIEIGPVVLYYGEATDASTVTELRTADPG